MARLKALSLLTMALILMAGCGSRDRASVILPLRENGSYGQVVREQSLDLSAILHELEEFSPSQQVDKAVLEQLKTALASELKARYEGKLASTPPLGDANCVTDLTLVDNGDGNYRLSWHYRNSGDYDQNGTVAIADITPLAQHFGQSYSTSDENCLLAVIDGSGNGTVDIADVTAIAVSFGATCSGYNVEASQTLFGGGFAQAGLVDLSEGTGPDRLFFRTYVPDTSGVCFRVVPVDQAHASGEPSEVEVEPETPPLIVSISPTSGMENTSVRFSATAYGSDPLTYSWSFGGGASPNTSASKSPTVTLRSPGSHSASLTVTNPYGSDTYPFTLSVTAAPAEPAKWHVMIYIGADNNLWLSTAFDILSQEDFTSDSRIQVSVALDMENQDTGARVAGFYFVGEDDSFDTDLNGASFNSASPAALAQYMSWVKSHYPADKYMLILYDHGGSWTKNTSGIIIDETSNPNRQMEIEALAETIAQSGMNVEVLTFRACVMQSIEVVSDLAGVVDYVVGSQTTQVGGEGAASYPFKELVTWLQQHPNSTARELAVKNNELYAQKFAGIGDKSTATSAIDCSKVPALVSSVAGLRSALSSVVGTSKSNIIDAMESSWRFITGDGDLGDFLDKLDARVSDTSVQTAIDDVRSKLSSAIVSNKLHYDAADDKTGDIRNCKGLSIFLATECQYTAEFASQYRTLSFATQTGWDDLLDQLNGSNPGLITNGGEMFGVLGWIPELSNGGPEVDLWVLEPTWDPELIWLSSPMYGLTTLNGYFSPDSWDTGYSWEGWQAKSLIYKGPYIFAAHYFCDGWGWIGCEVAFVGSLRGVETTLGPFYLDGSTIYEEELGPGWIFFTGYDRSVSSLGGFRQCTLREAGLTDTQITQVKTQLQQMVSRKSAKKGE